MYTRPGAFRCIYDNRPLWTWISHTKRNAPHRGNICIHVKIGHVLTLVLRCENTNVSTLRASERESVQSCQWRSRPHVMPNRAPITTSRMWCTCKNTRPKHAATLYGIVCMKRISTVAIPDARTYTTHTQTHTSTKLYPNPMHTNEELVLISVCVYTPRLCICMHRSRLPYTRRVYNLSFHNYYTGLLSNIIWYKLIIEN